MKQRFGSNLKVQIAAVASGLFLVAICLIAVISTRILHNDMQAVLSQQQLTATSFIARDIEAKVELRRNSLNRVAHNLPADLIANPGALQTWLEDRRAIHTLFPTGLMVVPADGGPTLAETPRLATRPKSFTDRDWFIGASTTGLPFISKPLIARATNQPALVIAIPLHDAGQNLLAVLAGVTPLTTVGFLDLIIGNRPGKQGSYQLIAPSHNLMVLSSDPSNAVTQLPDAGRDPILDAARKGLLGVHVIADAHGVEELVSIAVIAGPNWLLVARQPAREAFAAVDNTLRNILLITALISLPVVFILLTLLNHMLRPLARLAGELRAMADGSRPMHPLTTKSSDEVADVANSFNHLQQKLLAQEYQLADIARRDTLTGLANRRQIEERLDIEVSRTHRSNEGLALLFLDIDGFKPINDQHGHQIGDLVLQEIANRLRQSVREIDCIARHGGDEFLILLASTVNPADAARRVAADCIARISTPIQIRQLSLQVGVSIGGTIYPNTSNGTTDALHLISQADMAMYEAKRAGCNNFVLRTDLPAPPPDTPAP